MKHASATEVERLKRHTKAVEKRLALLEKELSSYRTSNAFAPRAFNIKRQNIVIIGGGVVGLSIAHHLKKNDIDNKLTVTVLDKEMGTENKDRGPASVNSLAYIYPKFGCAANEVVERLCYDSLTLHSDWAEDIGYSGTMENQGVAVPKNIDKFNFRGTPLVSVDFIREVEPLLSEEIPEWIYHQESEKYDSQVLLRSLRAACLEKGVVVSLGEKWDVECLEWNNDGKCTGVKLNSGEELQGTVVVANGASLNALMKDQSGEDLGIVPILPQESQCIVMKSAENEPFMKIRALGLTYVIPRDDGTVLVGDTGAVVLPGNKASIDATIKDAKTMVPSVDALEIVKTFTAIRAVTPDDIPIVGEVKESGMYVAGGLNAYGVTVAPLIAKAVGDLILNNGNVEGLDEVDVNVLESCNPDREVSKMYQNARAGFV